MDKLLSICVPTLDRSIFLDQLLSSIFAQITPELGSLMEICIDDDSVEDDTAKVVQKYIDRRMVDIHYHRNYRNTGLEQAILDCVAMSHGKYCWVISDDDLVITNSIQTVVDHIITDDYDYLIVEADFFDDRSGWVSGRIYGLEEAEFVNAIEYNTIMQKLFLPMTHICISVFSRELWDYEGNSQDDVSHRYFPHMKRVFHALPNSQKKTKVISHPTIDARAYNQSYSKDNLVVFYHHLPNIIGVCRQYDYATRKTVRVSINNASFSHLLNLRMLVHSKAFFGLEGTYHVNFAIFRMIYRNLSIKKRFVVLSVIVTPKFVLRKMWYIAGKCGAYKSARKAETHQKLLRQINQEKPIADGLALLHEVRGYISETLQDTEGDVSDELKQDKIQIAFVTTWNTMCGIAEYSRMLLEKLSDRGHISVYPNYGASLLQPDEPFVCTRLWRDHNDESLDDLITALKVSSSQIIHLQYNLGFFKLSNIAHLIRKLYKNKGIVITFHRTKHIPLHSIAEELRLCSSLVVHQHSDKQRLIGIGIEEKMITIIPHGQIVYPQERKPDLRKRLNVNREFVFGSYGFLLPNKGILECIQAISIIKKAIHNVLYIVSCALHFDPSSSEYYMQCVKTVSELGLEENVVFVTEFLSNEEIAIILQVSDMLLMPYKSSAESASGAVRFCVAARRPVIVTDLPIFDDFEGCCYKIPECTPETIATAVLDLLRNEAHCDKLVRSIDRKIAETEWGVVADQYFDAYQKIRTALPADTQIHASPETSSAVVKQVENNETIPFARVEMWEDSSMTENISSDVDCLLSSLSAMRQAKDNLPWKPLISHRRVIGSVIVFLKRIVRRCLKWYIDPIASQQSAFNNSVTDAVHALTNIISNTSLNNSAADAIMGKKQEHALQAGNNDFYDKKTFAQSGEDAILAFIFHTLSIPINSVTYLDLGACEPKSTSNTYYFYCKGARGVLVEANASLAKNLILERPDDVVLNNVADLHDGLETDFYILNAYGLSTASIEDMNQTLQIQPELTLNEVATIESITVNTIIERYFMGKAPTFISIDIEGTGVDVLKSINLEKYRPLCIVVETIPYFPFLNINIKDNEAEDYLITHDYVEYAFTGINSIFVDKRALEERNKDK